MIAGSRRGVILNCDGEYGNPTEGSHEEADRCLCRCCYRGRRFHDPQRSPSSRKQSVRLLHLWILQRREREDNKTRIATSSANSNTSLASLDGRGAVTDHKH